MNLLQTDVVRLHTRGLVAGLDKPGPRRRLMIMTIAGSGVHAFGTNQGSILSERECNMLMVEAKEAGEAT